MDSLASTVCEDMATCVSFQVQVASIMELLTKTTIAEITKLVDDAYAELQLEMCRSQRENEALKSKLLVMEGELRAARGCGERKPGSSLNIAFEIKVCDEFREAPNLTKVEGEGSVERDFDERSSTSPAKDEQYVGLPAEKKNTVPDALDIKYEMPLSNKERQRLFRARKNADPQARAEFLQQKRASYYKYKSKSKPKPPVRLMTPSDARKIKDQWRINKRNQRERLRRTSEIMENEMPLNLSRPVDREQDWSESVLSEDWLEEDPKTSQSQLEQKTSEEDAYGTSGAAAAANGGEGPLCEEEELHMQPCPAGDAEKWLLAELEPEGECLTPGHPLPGSTEGLEVQCAWSKATRSGKVQEMLSHHEGGSEHGGALSNDRLFPLHFRASARLCSEKNEGPTSHLERQQNVCPRGPSDGISTEMAFPRGSWGEHIGSTPCEDSFDASAEAESCQRIEGREEFVCTRCGKMFPDALELQMHEEQHDTGRWFGCSDCGKRFRYKGYLKIHQRVHTREKPFVCTQCGKSYSNIRNLRNHQITHTGEKCFRCTVCNKSFFYLHFLKRHQRVHTGEKPHSCDECGKSFSELGNLKTHQKVHTGEKPHCCDECGKSFAQLSNLKSHQRVHTREKPHHCDECGKSFSHPGNFKTHQIVHTGANPHRCNECGKSFAHRSNLKTHQRVHTGEKPYSCTLCGKSFSRNHVLQKHVLTHSY